MAYINNFLYSIYFNDCIDIILWYTYFKGVIMTNLEVLVGSMILLDLVAGAVLLIKGRDLVNGIKERNRRVDATVDDLTESMDEMVAARVLEATEHLDQKDIDISALSEQVFSLETTLKALGQEVTEMKQAKTVKKGVKNGKSSKKARA